MLSITKLNIRVKFDVSLTLIFRATVQHRYNFLEQSFSATSSLCWDRFHHICLHSTPSLILSYHLSPCVTIVHALSDFPNRLYIPWGTIYDSLCTDPDHGPTFQILVDWMTDWVSEWMNDCALGGLEPCLLSPTARSRTAWQSVAGDCLPRCQHSRLSSQWMSSCVNIIARGEMCYIWQEKPWLQTIYLCGDLQAFLTKGMRCVQ